MSKLVENMLLTNGATATPAKTTASASVAMGENNGAMFEVWLVGHKNLNGTDGLIVILEASNDGLVWSEPDDTNLKYTATSGTGTPDYVAKVNVSLVIPQAYVRLRFDILSATSSVATALLHADVRTYRAS